jgi:hypothetical protein
MTSAEIEARVARDEPAAYRAVELLYHSYLTGLIPMLPAVFDAWNELWTGAARAHDRFMRVDVIERRDRGDASWS